MINSNNVLTTLTQEQQKALVDLAVSSASELGYCDETTNVLSEMGFSTDLMTKQVVATVKMTLTIPYGVELYDSDFDYVGEGESVEIDLVSVEDDE